MIYDGNGCVVKWIIVTDGTVLTNELIESCSDDILFLKTDSGGITSTVIRNSMISIKRLDF